MEPPVETLFSEYDELAADVSRSTYGFFQDNLKRWLDFLDRTNPFARIILQQLESAADFKTWFEPYRVVAQGGGSKHIVWPPDRRKRLGIQLLLMRRFATGEVNPGFFARALMDSSQNANEGIGDITVQIFLPLSRELRRYMMYEVQRPGALDQTVVLQSRPLIGMGELIAYQVEETARWRHGKSRGVPCRQEKPRSGPIVGKIVSRIDGTRRQRAASTRGATV
jgi:hypothetical protein